MNLTGIGLAILGIIVATVVGIIAVVTRQRRRKIFMGSIAALLVVVSIGGLLFSFDILFRTSAPVADSLNLYTSNNDHLIAIKAKDATIRWQTAQINGVAPPLVVGDTLYAAGNLATYALHANNGQQIWRSGTSIVPIAVANGLLVGPTQSNSTINGSSFSALHTTDGSLAWTSTITTFGGNLVIQNATVYGGTSEGLVYALDLNDGHVLWSHSFASGQHDPNIDQITSLTASADSILGIIGIQNNLRLFALDPSTQQVRWQKTLAQAAWPIGGATAVAGVLYLGTGSDVEAYHTIDGTRIWTYPFTGNESTSLLVVDNTTLYFGGGGAVYAIKTQDGTAQWIHHESSDTFFLTVNIAQGVVFSRSQCTGPDELPSFRQCNFWVALRASDGFLYYRHGA
jgi:outer membrane protein assembly factor BamB